MDAELPASRPPLGADEGVTADDEPHPAPGELSVKADQFGRRAALRAGQAFPGRRPDEAIGQIHPADGRRFEEHRCP